MGRGGMQFMLIIWLQGIWLPLHGYNFSQTPLWAGIFLVPHHLTPAHAAYVAGREFFPHLISAPFHSGLGVAFGFAIAANVIAAVASALTGRRTPVPAARESLGYELAAVAAEGGFEPTELVVPEESTEPPDQPG
jgi:hypothetical protein